MANDLPFTVKDKAAPVVDVDQTVPPYATFTGALTHGADTLIAFAEDEASTPARSTAATASARLGECIITPYLPNFRSVRHP